MSVRQSVQSESSHTLAAANRALYTKLIIHGIENRVKQELPLLHARAANWRSKPRDAVSVLAVETGARRVAKAAIRVVRRLPRWPCRGRAPQGTAPASARNAGV